MPDTILVADDDRAVILLVKTLLERAGHRVLTASDGESARALVERDPARLSVVLLDWEMPNLTGIELLRWIKEQPELKNIPVIMQTAMDSAEQIREGIDAGAFYYLTKPIDQRLLLSIVNAALGDFHYKLDLVHKLGDSQNPFHNLVEGVFRYRTLEDGERLAVWIANVCPAPENAMGIVEIMANAVEHGNLAITYDEKSRFIESGTWRTEVERRLGLPEFADRHVQVKISRNSHELAVVVEDQGAGFDYKKYLVFDEKRAFDSHGRGIAMAGLFMGLEYLGRGNVVRVTIPVC
jgi:CheY-like chemotaxis protein